MAYIKDDTWSNLEGKVQSGAKGLFGLAENGRNWKDLMERAFQDANGVSRIDSEQAAYYNGTGGEVLETTGTAQAGGTDTITLASGESATDDYYVQIDGAQDNAGMRIEIVAGTGVGESKNITGYVGSTKVATVASNWTTQPDSTSVYEIYAQPVDDGKVGFGSKTGRAKTDIASMRASFVYLEQLDDFLNGAAVSTIDRAFSLGDWIS